MELKKTNVLVTGAAGQLGRRLVRCGEVRDDVRVTGLRRQELDVLDAKALELALDIHVPDVVIHAAAFTGVDVAESKEEEAMAVNGEGTRMLAEACSRRGICMLYVSTDYVFGDVLRSPLDPEAPVGPLGAYGRSKLAGEQAFASSGVCGAVVRVAWLYDSDPEVHNFLNTMLRLARDHPQIRVVNDQHGVPTASPLFADALLDMAARRKDMPQGIWHFAHEGQTTWHGFAKEIFRLANQEVDVVAVTSDERPTAARRPAWSVLNGEPLRKEMNWERVSWEAALERCWRLRSEL